eukprot:2807948-Pleurochrysis_carterae.AAC.2
MAQADRRALTNEQSHARARGRSRSRAHADAKTHRGMHTQMARACRGEEHRMRRAQWRGGNGPDQYSRQVSRANGRQPLDDERRQRVDGVKTVHAIRRREKLRQEAEDRTGREHGCLCLRASTSAHL